jgi:type IV pilus assembly protein PilX
MNRLFLRRGQRGMTLLLVLILLTVMMLGGLALARMAESSALVSGNVATKDASVHASEVGWNAAFEQVKALADEEKNAGNWYWASMQPTDPATGIPKDINFDTTPVIDGGVGRFTVTYAVERMCSVAKVTASTRECLVKFDPDTPVDMQTDPPDYQTKNSRQFRITVRVTDPRGTQTWTQSLVTKGAV